MTTKTEDLPGIAPGRDILLNRAQEAIAFERGRADRAETELAALADQLGAAVAETGRLRALLAVQGRAGEAEEHEGTAEGEEETLTPGEVARLFRVDPKTVTRWEAAGRLTSARTPGGHRRYRAREVRRLLNGDPEAGEP
jgi:excisionase family DNA binding protein